MIKGIIDRIEEDKIVIEFEDLSTGILPKKFFNNIKQGSEITITAKIKEKENIDVDDMFK